MRIILLLMSATALASSGCSLFIANNGKNLETLQTRDQVHKDFGTPVATGTVDGDVYEDFRSRRKIAEPLRAMSMEMGWAMTFGLAEAIMLPRELFLLSRRTVIGEDIRFIYDSNGCVKARFLDGKNWVWFGRMPVTQGSDHETPP